MDKSKTVVWSHGLEYEGHKEFESQELADSFVSGFFTGCGMYAGDEGMAQLVSELEQDPYYKELWVYFENKFLTNKAGG